MSIIATVQFHSSSDSYVVVVEDRIIFSVWSSTQAEEVARRVNWTHNNHGHSVEQAVEALDLPEAVRKEAALLSL